MKSIIITTASNMTETTYNYICEGFRQKFGVDVSFHRIIDDDIIGGFITEINGEIFDLSIASQLKRMKEHIAG